MPEIQLCPDGHDGDRLLATMYFPDNAARRRAFFTEASRAFGSHEQSPRVRINPNTISDQGWGGTVAGSVLAYIAVMSELDLKEPSVRSAVYALRAHAINLNAHIDEYPETGDREERDDQLLVADGHVPFTGSSEILLPRPGKPGMDTQMGLATDHSDGMPQIVEPPVPEARRTIEGYWANFSTVAHLWAAHKVLEQSVPFYAMDQGLRDDETRREFLGHAQWFLDFAQDHSSSRNKDHDALVEPDKPWTVVPRVEPTKPELSFLFDRVLNELKGYRAT